MFALNPKMSEIAKQRALGVDTLGVPVGEQSQPRDEEQADETETPPAGVEGEGPVDLEGTTVHVDVA